MKPWRQATLRHEGDQEQPFAKIRCPLCSSSSRITPPFESSVDCRVLVSISARAGDSLEEISDLAERKSPARAAAPWGCLVLGQPSFSPLTLSSFLGSCHYRSVQKPGGDRWNASFAEKTSVTISTSCPEAMSWPPQGEAPSANPPALHSPPSCKLCPILLRTILKKPVVFLLEIIYNHRKVCEISSNFNHQVTPWSKFLSTRD